MRSVSVQASRSYEVLIGRGLLDEAGARVKAAAPKAETAVIVSGDRVWPLYGARGSLAGKGGLSRAALSHPARGAA